MREVLTSDEAKKPHFFHSREGGNLGGAFGDWILGLRRLFSIGFGIKAHIYGLHGI